MSSDENVKNIDFSMPLGRANLIGVPFFLLSVAVVVILFYYTLGDWVILLRSLRIFLNPVILIPLLIIGTVIHECLHVLGWKVFGQQPWSVFKFGLNWKTVTPYAHCQVPLKASAYRKGTVLPGLILGVLPSAAGILLQDGVVTLFGAFFLGAACGDFLSLWLMRSVHPDSLVKDHPTRAGCRVLENSPEV